MCVYSVILCVYIYVCTCIFMYNYICYLCVYYICIIHVRIMFQVYIHIYICVYMRYKKIYNSTCFDNSIDSLNRMKSSLQTVLLGPYDIYNNNYIILQNEHEDSGMMLVVLRDDASCLREQHERAHSRVHLSTIMRRL